MTEAVKWTKDSKHYKCSVGDCPNEAVGRYSPDLDISGIKFCAEHADTVAASYLAILQGNPEIAEKLLKGDAKLTPKDGENN